MVAKYHQEDGRRDNATFKAIKFAEFSKAVR
jgi:hypothetical protein